MATGEPASAGPDEANTPNAVSLRFSLIMTGILIAALVAIGLLFDFGQGERVLVDEPLELPDIPASQMVEAGPEVIARAIRFTPDLSIQGPTTLEVELTRSDTGGWVGVTCTLIHQKTGEAREVNLSSDRRHQAGRNSSEGLHATARLDRVETGRYVMRLEPGWEPAAPITDEATPEQPPTAHIRITEGRRSPITFLLALGVLLLPLAIAIFRRITRPRTGDPTPRNQQTPRRIRASDPRSAHTAQAESLARLHSEEL